MTHLKRLALAGTLALGTGGMASAATYTDCSAFGSPDITDRVSTAVGCEVRIDASQDFLETDPMTVNEGDGFFDNADWSVDKIEGNPPPGAYDFSSYFTDMVGDVLVVFKGGDNPLVGYLLDTADLSGTWSNPFTDPPFDLPGEATAQAVSHITIYGDVAPIPVPAAGVLMLGALGALGGLAARRRRG